MLTGAFKIMNRKRNCRREFECSVKKTLYEISYRTVSVRGLGYAVTAMILTKKFVARAVL